MFQLKSTSLLNGHLLLAVSMCIRCVPVTTGSVCNENLKRLSIKETWFCWQRLS